MQVINTADNYPLCLSSRSGEYLGVDPVDNLVLQKLAATYPEDVPFDNEKEIFLFAAGDPRRFLGKNETTFLAFRTGHVGILTEIELDVTIGDDDSDGLTFDSNGTRPISPKEMDMAIAAWQVKLNALQPNYPHSELFLAYGAPVFDGRLTLCAFTPLSRNEMHFDSPYQEPDAIAKLDSALGDLAYPPGSKVYSDTHRIYQQLVMMPVGIQPVDSLLTDAIGVERAKKVLKQGDYAMIDVLVRKYGGNETCALINRALRTSLNIGEYLLRSEQAKGYWCNDFGWVSDIASATGYDKATVDRGIPQMLDVTDAVYVRIDQAENFN